jgi:7,8-dihydro-6-hydroxymethylpterin dimethyltransferase
VAQEYYLRDVQAVCPVCLALCAGRVRVAAGTVYLDRVCATHGKRSSTIATDVEYYRRSSNTPTATFVPPSSAAQESLGCPHDCGPCQGHVGSLSVVIVEALDECNMRCPTCIAASFPGAGKVRSLGQIRANIDAAVRASQGQLQTLMISGGEPTIHPNLIELMNWILESTRIPHIVLITNGVLLPQQIDLLELMQRNKDRVEVFLQFDSLRKDVLVNIRGDDLTSIRRQSLQVLKDREIATTLVCVVKRGLNDDEVGELVRLALNSENIRGINFQPIREAGRLERYDASQQITMTEVRQQLLDSLSDCHDFEVLPHPASPDTVAIGYLVRSSAPRGVTSAVLADSKKTAEASQTPVPLFLAPAGETAGFRNSEIVRVAVITYLDKHNFTVDAARRSCMHFALDDGRIVPFDTYFMLRGGSAPTPARSTG